MCYKASSTAKSDKTEAIENNTDAIAQLNEAECIYKARVGLIGRYMLVSDGTAGRCGCSGAVGHEHDGGRQSAIGSVLLQRCIVAFVGLQRTWPSYTPLSVQQL